MGSTDWPANECILHFGQPPALFAADRFFPDTFCNIPPFWQFSFPDYQTAPQWYWIEGNHWCEHFRPWNSDSKWQYDVKFVGPGNNVSITMYDNPAYNPPGDPFPHLCRIRVFTTRFALPLADRYYFEFGFNSPISPVTRDISLTVPALAWVAEFGNLPGAVPPDGPSTWNTAMCQPDWDINQNPR